MDREDGRRRLFMMPMANGGKPRTGGGNGDETQEGISPTVSCVIMTKRRGTETPDVEVVQLKKGVGKKGERLMRGR